MARIEGIVSANLTPFDLKGNLQEEILRHHVQSLVRAKVNALGVLGSVGEGPSMPIEMRKRAAQVIIETVEGRIPVVVMTGAPDTLTAVELSKHAERIGADGVYVVPPYYYNLDVPGLVEHFRRIASAVAIPVYIYSIPEYTKANISADLFARLSQIPGIAGIKLSTYDLTLLEDCIELTNRRLGVFNGKDGLVLASSVVGASGSFSALCTAFPELFVRLWESFKNGNLRLALRYQQRINAVRRVIAKYPPYETLKEIVRLRGEPMGHARPPLRLLTDEEQTKLKGELASLDLINSRRPM